MLDIEDFKKSIGNKSRLLGIDPGKKRIGLAISDEDKLVSTPLKTILKKKFFDFIKEIKEIEYFPRYLEIEAYDGCNLNCVMCPLGKDIYDAGGGIDSDRTFVKQIVQKFVTDGSEEELFTEHDIDEAA